MSEKSTRGQVLSASLYYSHCSHENHVNQMIHFVRLKVIEASLINCLSKNFDRWLSSILFFSRHVEVIDKNNQFVTWYFWPIDTLSLFFKARLNVILYLI